MDASNMLMEHQPTGSNPAATPQGSIYSPSEDERKLLKKCEAVLTKNKKVRAKADYAWIDYYKMFRGKQWKEQRPSYRSSEVFNLVWQAIQSQVPIIMDIRPKFEYLPTEPQDREFADIMNDVCAADWARYNWGFTLSEVIYDSHIYGTGLSSLKFDPKKDCIHYKSKSPFHMFPDASAEDFSYKCDNTVDVEPFDIEKIKRLFPDKADYIKSDIVDFYDETRVDLSSVKYNSPSSDRLYMEVIGGFENNKIPEVLVKTFYFADDETLEDPEEEKLEQEGNVINGGEIDDQVDQVETPEQRLKYPKGRMIIIANETILHDGPNEYDGDARFPFQRLINYINPRSFWGISEIEPLESPQRVFNKLVSYVLDVLFLTGNPIWVVDTTSGVDTQNLTNQPGLIIEKEPGSDVHREPGVQLQPYVLSVIDKLKEWFEQLAGSQDVTRGIAPGSVTAASAIADLQNAAQTRIRMKMKNLDAYLQDLGQQYASRVMQFYTAPRVFRLTGKDGTEKYFKMHIQDVDGVKTAFVQRFTDNNLLNPTAETYQLRGSLDVRVTTGSSLPFSKAQTEQRELSLFDRGIIDSEEVLKRLDYPNWEAVQQRMQAAAAQQAQLQAATQTQPKAA